jgi:hypothetical protein
LSWQPEVHSGTEGLARAIENLGMPLARRAAELGARGCDVVVNVLQEMSTDSSTTGLHLTSSAVAWLAAAGACVDVDQYVDA